MNWASLVGKGVLVQFKRPVLLGARSAGIESYGISAHYLRAPEGEIPAMLPALSAKVTDVSDDAVSFEYQNGAGDTLALHVAKKNIEAVSEVVSPSRILSFRAS
jgi:hypothetical protein